MHFVRKLIRGMQAALPKSDKGVVILAYHLVGGNTSSPVDIPLSVFRRQMQELKERAQVCSLDEAVWRLEKGASCRGPVVAVTFDDAYENFYSHAWPILWEFQIPAVLYTPVDFIEGAIAPPIRGTVGMEPCSWTQLTELVRSGLISIGSHSCTHSNLRTVSLPVARHEISQSRVKLEDRLGVAVDSFCYPKGQWTTRLEGIVQEHYRTAVIGGGRRMHPTRWKPYRLKRIPIRRDMPIELYPMLTSPFWLEAVIASFVRRWILRRN